MKKQLLPLLLSCFAAASVVPSKDASAQAVQVIVDPRLELMGVIQLLNGYMLTTQYEFPYKQDARIYFAEFQDHAAVSRFAEMSRRSFNFDAVPKAMLSLSTPPDLVRRVPFSEYVVQRAGGLDSLREFVEALRDFAVESDFNKFFDAHRGTYGIIVDSSRSAVEKAVEVLRRYSGMNVEGGTVILGPLLHHGGFAAMIERDSDSTEVYAIVGPVAGRDGLPYFGSPSHIAGTAWHEFSHTFINPLTDRHWDDLGRYEGLYAPIADAMVRQAYPNWRTAVNEHIIRAITTRLVYVEEGIEAGAEALEQQKKRGFAYVDALVERLEEFEGSRDVYPSIAEFYPRLVDAFRDVHDKNGN